MIFFQCVFLLRYLSKGTLNLGDTSFELRHTNLSRNELPIFELFGILAYSFVYTT
jgi:hypothetical protein